MKYVRVNACLALMLGCALVLFAQPQAVAEQEGPHLVPAAGHGGDSVATDHIKQGSEPNPLAVDLDLAIWTGVVFAVLMGVLGKFAWPTISAALVEREERIEGNIAGAQAKHDEAKQLLAEHEAKLAGAASEVRSLMEEARRDAEATKSQIVAAAKEAADQERDRAVRDVQRAADHAMTNLAETSANLAVDLASTVVRQNITPDQQAQLVRDALGKLAITNPSKN